jgi:hypothetical protein
MEVRYQGGCHCGNVRFEVTAATDPVCWDCNCSICTKAGFLHLIVPKSHFRLLRGEEDLIEYRFNTGAARHLFCRACGIKSFYVPRSNPDGYDVNLRCLEPVPSRYRVEPFDGQHWEEHATVLAHLSREVAI